MLANVMVLAAGVVCDAGNSHLDAQGKTLVGWKNVSATESEICSGHDACLEDQSSCQRRLPVRRRRVRSCVAHEPEAWVGCWTGVHARQAAVVSWHPNTDWNPNWCWRRLSSVVYTLQRVWHSETGCQSPSPGDVDCPYCGGGQMPLLPQPLHQELLQSLQHLIAVARDWC